MNKIWLIIVREFLMRVQKKSFLVTTILVPLIFPTIIGILAYIVTTQAKLEKPNTVQVVDQSGKFHFKDDRKFTFVDISIPLDKAKKAYQETNDFALLYIPASIDIQKPEGIVMYTKENHSIEKVNDLESILKKHIQSLKIEEYKIDKKVLESLAVTIHLKQINVSQTGEEKASDSKILFGLGFSLGILIYLFVLVYGIQVMHSVIDEKSSKVVEIIISSVKPFQLMVGKITGIAMVGLLQFIIWAVLIVALSSAVLGYFGLTTTHKQATEEVMKSIANDEMKVKVNQPDTELNELVFQITQIPYAKILSVFMFYFLGGYLLYGALFAAVGSAVETIQESQQFQFPITLPLLIGYFGLFMFILKDPHGTVSFWFSIIPFTSPVAMVGRIPFDVPGWQLLLSMFLLAAAFLFITWIAGRIYRVGILTTGTKVNWKVLLKWFLMKN